MARRTTTTIAVISDTHGRLRPEALDAARGAALILHAGDVGNQSVLDELSAIAPVVVVRGNVDTGPFGEALPATATLEVRGIRIHMLHELRDLAIDPVAAGVSVVISGHTHRAAIDVRDGVLYLNPGGAGPQRFRLPITMATLRIGANGVEPELVTLVRP